MKPPKITVSNSDLIISMIFLSIAATPVFIFWYLNKDTLKVERFYYKKSINAFNMLQASLFFLLLCCAIYSRVIIIYIFERIIKYLTYYIKPKKIT